jgi:hypothetical protein
VRASGQAYRTLRFTPTFLETLLDKEFTAADRRALVKALSLLDSNERHPSLRVHELKEALAGFWSVSASKSLRMTFIREAEGIKRLMTCSHHYGD